MRQLNVSKLPLKYWTTNNSNKTIYQNNQFIFTLTLKMNISQHSPWRYEPFRALRNEKVHGIEEMASGMN